MAKKFLMADDDSDDKELFAEALHKIDSSIVCYMASDGKEVLDKLKSKEFNSPQIIFLDINMPEMNGWQCLTALKKDETHKHIPVIMYSTSSAKRDVEIALEFGALCFYEKPSDFKELKKFLELVYANLEGDLCNALKVVEQSKVYKVYTASKEPRLLF
jgi:CheY-like chemotaxis protein